MTSPSVQGNSPLRIFRCEHCRKPCMLTTLDCSEMKFCPVDQHPVDWRQVNRGETAVCTR
ncbi:hypothetical protein [Methanoregula boonei]|uniref:hypothetical protein n=1 Tax=Methanoregula boonei TaxID=358766 RepID=UPI0012FC2EE5|nr:hypothetical protein [Methanoregula boonei]